MNMMATDRNVIGSDFLAGLKEAPPITEEMVSGTFWQLSSLEQGVLRDFMVLAPQGLIGVFSNPSVDFWQIVNGRLCFIDNKGMPSAIFNVAKVEDSRVVALAGRGVINDVNSIYILTMRDHPPHPISATPPDVVRRATFLKQPHGGVRRPNLVVVRANSKSLHTEWLADVGDATRSWDLCISSYEQEQPDLSLQCEYLTHQPNQKKFKPIYDLFYEGSPLWNYDRIWLPDDDLSATGEDVNRLFHLSRKYSLDLSQPSLKRIPGCHINHPLTGQQPNTMVRLESFVEIMCPLFSRRAFKICVGTLRDAVSGYGLDHLWPAFLGRPRARIGIIDAVGIVHTRPIGATYKIQEAIDEQTATFKAYDFIPTKIQGVW